MCNGEWEHHYGVHIETLDNPGWHVRINLTGTRLQNQTFKKIEYGTDSESNPIDPQWMSCFVKQMTFHGYAGSKQLEEILNHFLDWAENCSEQAL